MGLSVDILSGKSAEKNSPKQCHLLLGVKQK